MLELVKYVFGLIFAVQSTWISIQEKIIVCSNKRKIVGGLMH